MLLNACRIRRKSDDKQAILLAFEIIASRKLFRDEKNKHIEELKDIIDKVTHGPFAPRPSSGIRNHADGTPG